MIIFFADGRLGNQLFQYCGLRTLSRSDSLCVFGMDALRRCFDGHTLRPSSLGAKLARSLVRRLGQRRIDRCARTLHLLTLAEESAAEEGIAFTIRPGLLRRWYYVPTAFFQAENIVTSATCGDLQLKPEIVSRAARLLEPLGRTAEDLVFVHLRRGDYVSWPSAEQPAVLPLSWYHRQMERFRSRNPRTLFVVISDDRPYADEFLADSHDVWISRATDMIDDFALMTLCGGGGILSASSFSWWGAYFSRRAHPAAQFIAPLHWAGARLGAWYPPVIKTGWIEYRPLCA
jgi:hypothetical protein